MAMNSTVTVADRVRGLAATQRITQAQLADELKLSRMSMTRRFNGTVPFKASELEALASFLGVPVGAFFGEVAA